jgi:hypothetical protein
MADSLPQMKYIIYIASLIALCMIWDMYAPMLQYTIMIPEFWVHTYTTFFIIF